MHVKSVRIDFIKSNLITDFKKPLNKIVKLLKNILGLKIVLADTKAIVYSQEKIFFFFIITKTNQQIFILRHQGAWNI